MDNLLATIIIIGTAFALGGVIIYLGTQAAAQTQGQQSTEDRIANLEKRITDLEQFTGPRLLNMTNMIAQANEHLEAIREQQANETR